MNRVPRLRQIPLLRFTVVRFGIVGLLGEGLYFLLYGLFLTLTGSTSSSLALAGGLCILVNAYSHSRITFRVRFSKRLLLGYLQIQLFGFGLGFLSGLALEQAGTGKWWIALITYALWSTASFILTRVLYRAQSDLPKTDHTKPLPETVNPHANR
jgi:putative flippase GtrA